MVNGWTPIQKVAVTLGWAYLVTEAVMPPKYRVPELTVKGIEKVGEWLSSASRTGKDATSETTKS